MTAVGLQDDISPNDLLASAGWDELPGELVELRAGEVLPVYGYTVWFPLTAVIRTEAGPGRVLGGWVDHRGAVGLNGETELSTGLKWVVSSHGAALVVNIAYVDALMDRSHRFTRAAVDWLQQSLSEARQLAASNASDSASSRVARLLLSMDGQGRPGSILVINQEEVARLISVRRTTVSAIMKGFKVSKVISYARCNVRVIDRSRLESLAKGGGTIVGLTT